MYQIIDATSDKIIAEVEDEDLRLVMWSDEYNCWLRTNNLLEAQCVALDGVRYNILGRPMVEDAEAPVIVLGDNLATAHFQTEKNLGVTQRDLQDIAWGMQKMAQEIVEMLDAASEVMDVSAELLNVTKE